jgi:hypothetical protein
MTEIVDGSTTVSGLAGAEIFGNGRARELLAHQAGKEQH